MNSPFVWFHHRSRSPEKTAAFYEKLAGWKKSAGPDDMTMFAGEGGPFAGVEPAGEHVSGWVPYLQVEDVDAATTRAKKLGAEVLEPRTSGPAGDYAIVRDPGGATLALWQKA